MDFSEKLNTLFAISQTKGKDLAAAMNVTPPQVSKMRRGGRGLPKSRDAALVLARFFAQRCRSDQQRDALSKTMRIAMLRSLESEERLAELLLDWLADRQDPDDYAAQRADDFLRDFSTPPASVRKAPGGEEPRRALGGGEKSFFAYYGNDGRRWAVLNFLGYLAQKRQPFTIDILSDESTAWVTETPDYPRRLQAAMLRLAEQGCVYRRISGPIADLDQAFESLNRWLPLYLAGKASSYYYRRMRDNLNRITLFVVEGVAALFSLSVGGASESGGVTFFTVDTQTVNALRVEFERYFSLCVPIMNVYSMDDSPKRLFEALQSYESSRGSCLQRSDSLSLITLPWDVAISIRAGERGAAEKSAFLAAFAQRYKHFKANLKNYPTTDIIRLAELEDIMAGRVPISASCVFSGEPQFYTPRDYLQHLRSVGWLLEHEKNYHVVLRQPEDADPTIVYVKEGSCALLLRAATPFSVFEVSERYLVDAFAETLRRFQPGGAETPADRRAVAARLKALVGQIERRMQSGPG